MRKVYFIVSLMSDKSQYYSADSLSDCIDFIRQQNITCLYKWRLRFFDKDTLKCIFTGNLGSFFFG